MRGYLAAALSTVLTASFVTSLTTSPADAAHHRHRACPKCCLKAYGYATDHEIAAGQLLLKAELSQKLKRKEGDVNILRFHVPASALTVDHVRLDQIGLSIDDTGRCIFTGRITHNAAEDIRGNLVSVYLRAYAADPTTRADLANAPVVWQSDEYRVWVRRGQPHHLAPVSIGTSGIAGLKRHYAEISHIEVELQYHKGR